MNKSKKIILTISIIIYIISLTQEGFCTNSASQCAKGFMYLLVGWLGVFMLHPPAMVWLANPILLFSWIHIKKKKKSLILSSISLITMLSFLFFDEIILNESGAYSRIMYYGLGYWLWVLSALIMVLGNGILFYKNKKEE